MNIKIINIHIYIFFFFILIYITKVKSIDLLNETIELSIAPVMTNTYGIQNIFKRSEDTLNVTCKIITNSNKVIPIFQLAWDFPRNFQYSSTRLSLSHKINEVNLVIKNLQESDSGEYKCTAKSDKNNTLFKIVQIYVKRKCGDNSFTCPDGICILRHYLCDGIPDCHDASDEKIELCGLDACDGKLKCDGRRCIPFSFCCDHSTDINCSINFRPPCCNKYIKPFYDESNYLEHQKLGDMGFLQTTIYTVVGCGMAFMLIVTILVLAICRVQMNRNLISRCNPSRYNRTGRPIHHHGLQHVPLYDLDMLLGHSNNVHQDGPGRGFMVSYNINNGVQIVGKPVDPPPYIEVVEHPPNEGPPPAYSSQENISTTHYSEGANC